MKGVGLKGFFVPFGIVVGIAASGLVLVRWGMGPSDSLPPTGESAHSPAADERVDGLPVGSLVPDLPLKPFGKGAPVRLSQLLNDRKVLMLNFWATWCAPCKIEMPSLAKLRKENAAHGLEIVAINMDEDPEKTVPPALNAMGVDLPIYLDSDQAASDAFAVQAIPFTVVLSQDRKVLYSFMGEKDWNSSEFQERMSRWLAGEGAGK